MVSVCNQICDMYAYKGVFYQLLCTSALDQIKQQVYDMLTIRWYTCICICKFCNMCGSQKCWISMPSICYHLIMYACKI